MTKEMEKIIEELKKLPFPIIPSPAEAKFLEQQRNEENFLGDVRKTIANRLKKKDSDHSKWGSEPNTDAYFKIDKYDIENLILIFKEHADKADLKPNDYGETFNIARALHVICNEIEILKGLVKKEPRS